MFYTQDMKQEKNTFSLQKLNLFEKVEDEFYY